MARRKGPKKPRAPQGYRKKKQKNNKRMGKKAMMHMSNPKSKSAKYYNAAMREYELIDDCLIGYQAALLNPFDSPAVCIPHSPNLPNLGIFKTIARVTMATAVDGGGAGWVCAIPTMSNATKALVYTNGTVDAPLYTETVAGGVASQVGNSPYVNASFDTGAVTGRVATMGLRIRYVGTELNLAGTCWPFTTPQHEDYLGKSPYNYPHSFPGARSFPVSRQWTSTIWTPTTNVEYAYSANANYSFAKDGSVSTEYPCGITVIGAVAGSPFEVELFTIFECAGTLITSPVATYSDDTRAAAIVEQVVSQPPSEMQKMARTAFDKVKDWAWGHIKAQAAGAVRAATSYITQIF